MIVYKRNHFGPSIVIILSGFTVIIGSLVFNDIVNIYLPLVIGIFCIIIGVVSINFRLKIDDHFIIQSAGINSWKIKRQDIQYIQFDKVGDGWNGKIITKTVIKRIHTNFIDFELIEILKNKIIVNIE